MDVGISDHLERREAPLDEPYESRLRLLERYAAAGFYSSRQRGIAIAGTPARVREEIERQVAASGCTYFVFRLMFGNLAEADAVASIDLFAAEVMPPLARLGPEG